MAFTVLESSASITTTERSLPADTTTGVPTSQTTECYMQVWLDLNLLVAGDEFELAFYEKVQTAGTQRAVQRVTVSGTQGTPIYVHPPLHLRNGYDVTLKKLTGTDRVINWSLRRTA